MKVSNIANVGQLSQVVPFLLLEQRYGMACQAMLRQPRRCRCLRTGWRHTCSAAATKLFAFDWHFLFLVIISPQNRGPCNSFYSLGHFKNVCDSDDETLCASLQKIHSRSNRVWTLLLGHRTLFVPRARVCFITAPVLCVAYKVK